MKYFKIVNFSLVLLIFITLACCSFDSSIQNIYDNTKEEITTLDVGEFYTTPENEEEKNYVDTLCGSWLLEEVAFWYNVGAIKHDRPIVSENKYIGTIFEYQKDYLKVNNTYYENPKYQIDIENYFNSSIFSPNKEFQKFDEFVDKYNVNLNNIVQINVSIEGNKPDLGLKVYLIDDEYILLSGFSMYIIARKVNPMELSPKDIPQSVGNPNPVYIYGKWKIFDNYVVDSKLWYEDGMSFNPQITTDIASKYIGQIFEYQRNYCVFNGKTYNNPIYAYDVELGNSTEEMQNFYWNFQPIIEKYNLDNNTHFKYIQQSLIFENEQVNDIGCYPCYINANYIIFMLWNKDDKYNIFLVAEKLN